jgi:hypothetical protein
MQQVKVEVSRRVNPKTKANEPEQKLVFRPFIQTPNEVVKEGQRPVFSDMWGRRCGNP